MFNPRQTLSKIRGNASDFDPIDLVGTLIVNGVVTNIAAKNPSFRIGLWKDKNGEVPAWADARLVAGIGALFATQFVGAVSHNPTTRKLGMDAATGLLNSYVATEQCRSSAEDKMKAAGTAGAKNADPYLLGYDDDDSDDDLFDADVLGLDADMDELHFAYGW